MSQQRIPVWITAGVIPVVNVLLASIAAGFIFWFLGINPFDALKAMVYGAFGNSYGWGYTLY